MGWFLLWSRALSPRLSLFDVRALLDILTTAMCAQVKPKVLVYAPGNMSTIHYICICKLDTLVTTLYVGLFYSVLFTLLGYWGIELLL